MTLKIDFPRRQFIKSAALLGAGLIVAKVPEAQTRSESFSDVVRYHGGAFGSTWTLALPALSGSQASRATSTWPEHTDALDYLTNTVERVNQAFSPYRTGSELHRFNQHSGLEYFRFSDYASPVVEAALRQARYSKGIFDPTVGPSVHRWGHGPIIGSQACSFHDLEITLTGQSLSVRKQERHATLDCCGLAKGFALQQIADGFAEIGYTDFFIELGGEVLASGVHPSGRAWRTGLAWPQPSGQSPGRKPYCVIELDQRAIATSGVYQNAYMAKNRRYHHIIDTRTGEPSSSQMLSVSVLHEDAMWADCWSTTLLATSYDIAVEMISQNKLSVLILSQTEESLQQEIFGRVKVRQG